MATCSFCGSIILPLHSCCVECGQKAEPPLPEKIGRYRPLALLGEGTMGNVFVAEHPGLGCKVALKILRTRFLGHHEARERLLIEARAVARLNHPSIVKIYDANISEDGRPYLVMELLSGQTLTTYLHEKKTLSLEEACILGAEIADALSAAHSGGVIHRDLKPDNIFLLDGEGENRLKLLDFSIAKLLTKTPGPDEGLTQIGFIVGTPAYMAPEQARGRENLDYRADLYALGVILFEMLSGSRPFASESSMEILRRKITEKAPDIRELRPDIPEKVAEFLQSLLSPSVYERPSSSEEVRDTLRAFSQEKEKPAALPAPPPTPKGPEVIRPPKKRSLWQRYRGKLVAALFGASSLGGLFVGW